ncbi:S100P-binding protein-like isoform X2 [Apus apus]|uniref:S100P-binding protein-like isoform X2 n=1 Tax=Apus apus TaxID=8895 RepID=UPI0021F89488|nr:S100P-binding protein-like isoform X2 [Apus apus]
MDDPSPQAFGLGLCHEFRPPVPRPKRLLDSSEQVQALQSAKKACVGSHLWSTPEELPLCSPDYSFQESCHFLDSSGYDDLAASSSASKYDDVAISLDTTRCFDDEPDDSLLELSESEGNSSFNYTEEEIQEILADDGVESKWYLTRSSTLSQNGDEERENEETSSCTGTSFLRDDEDTASEMAEPPNEPLSREGSPLGYECYPTLPRGRAGLDENQLQSAQVTRKLFELDLQELLSLSPIDADCEDQPLEGISLEEAKREASEAVRNDEKTARSCIPEESLEELVADGQQSLQSSPEDSSPPGLPRTPTPSTGSRDQELSGATGSCFSGKLHSPEDDGRQELSEAEQPSSSTKLSDAAEGQNGQEETTSGKNPGKAAPVPQEKERLNQGTWNWEAELEQRRHFSPECACLDEERSSCYSRDPSSGELPSYSPQGCVSQPCLIRPHLGPSWQEQVRTSPVQQGGPSSEDCP